MDFNLTPYQARVIGCLLEKEITTPEQYPLSLNALTNACNQKSNRDPVLNLDESAVQHVLDELAKEHLVMDKSGFGSRTTKYQHRFCNTVVGSLQFTEQELGIICVLLLRGPQTPGELRTRTNRLCKFSDVNEVEAVLDRLGQANNGPFVVKLSRQAGKRESRYAHLFSGEVEDVVENIAVSVSAENDVNGDRLDRLEREMDELRMELAEIKALLSK